MKIIISTYDDVKNPHYGGGGAIALHELAKKLSVKHDLKVISWNHSGVKNETIDGVSYTRIGLKFIPAKIGQFIFQMILPLYAIFRKYDFWIENFGPPFTTSFLPVFTKKPVLGVVHMLAAEDMKRKYKIDLSFIENAGIRRYRNTVATQETIREKILNINPKSNCNVISNGIDKIYPEKTVRKKQLLFLGRLEVDQKGLDLLISAFQKFTQKNREGYQLVIAGSGLAAETEKLKTRIKNAELGNNVTLVGRVEGESKHKLMMESAAMVLTSRFETFSMVALESLAYGLPLVTFDIEGLKWIPGNAVRKANAFDAEDLVEKISEVLDDTNLQEEIRSNGLNYAEKYTWDNIAKEYEKLINEIVDAKK